MTTYIAPERSDDISRTRPRLFFGVSTGRSGTMAIANALNQEPGVTCTHEGKFRHREVPRDRVLRFLTLENRLAYERPQHAAEIFESTRGDIYVHASKYGGTHFGDIAYNYAPFLESISMRYPEARLIVFVRNGIDFVRSATQAAGEDQTPVGWPPRGKPLTAVERYVGLGRLAPRRDDPLAARWGLLDHIARNAWLWAETNRLILNGVSRREAGTTFIVRYEEFFANPLASYETLREFLGFAGKMPADVAAMLRTPINQRASKVVGVYEVWTESQREAFRELAGAMMHRLGYALPEPAS